MSTIVPYFLNQHLALYSIKTLIRDKPSWGWVTKKAKERKEEPQD